MYLYLDLIWLLNFLIDYLLLWMTALLRKQAINKWRVCVAAGIGSCYVLFLFLPPLQPLYTFWIKAVLSAGIVVIAFGYGTLKKFTMNFLMFYFVSFVTGGGLLAAHFYVQSNHEIVQGIISTQSSGYGDKISWIFVGIGFPIMFWFSKSRWEQVEAAKLKGESLTKVTLCIHHSLIECTGLVDTGNQLYEPITKAPVMMVEASCLSGSIPESLFHTITQKDGLLHVQDLELSTEWLQRIRIIPYRGVRQGMELMLAIKPDWVKVMYEENMYCSQKVLIGINPYPLSSDGVYQAIIHPALLQNQQKEEAILHAN